MHYRLKLFSQLLCQSIMSGLWMDTIEAPKAPGDLGGRSSLGYGDSHESNHPHRLVEQKALLSSIHHLTEIHGVF